MPPITRTEKRMLVYIGHRHAEQMRSAASRLASAGHSDLATICESLAIQSTLVAELCDELDDHKPSNTEPTPPRNS